MQPTSFELVINIKRPRCLDGLTSAKVEHRQQRLHRRMSVAVGCWRQCNRLGRARPRSPCKHLAPARLSARPANTLTSVVLRHHDRRRRHPLAHACTIGLPVICIDARHAKAVLKMQINKSDHSERGDDHDPITVVTPAYVRLRVKMRRTRIEHILSALPPLATEERTFGIGSWCHEEANKPCYSITSSARASNVGDRHQAPAHIAAVWQQRTSTMQIR
jgi:hypothetical protein